MKYKLPQSLVIFLLLFALYSGILFADNHHKKIRLYTDPVWYQGNVGLIFLYPVMKIASVQVSFTDPYGKIRAKIPMFRYKFSKEEGAKTVLVTLFGLGPELPTGTYSISILSKKNQSPLWETKITLKPKFYPKRIIHFKSKKSNITSEITEERKEQAERFYKVLSTYHHDHIFATNSIKWPIKKKWKVSSTFGERRTFIFPNGKKQSDFHDGYDLAGLSIGDPVYAATSGKVVLAEYRIVTGNTIIIEHLPGTFTLYYHLNDLQVQEGDDVSSEIIIGHLGKTGFATGPHLHFSVRINGSSVDPQLLTKEPILNKKWILEKIKQSKNPVL